MVTSVLPAWPIHPIWWVPRLITSVAIRQLGMLVLEPIQACQTLLLCFACMIVVASWPLLSSQWHNAFAVVFELTKMMVLLSPICCIRRKTGSLKGLKSSFFRVLKLVSACNIQRAPYVPASNLKWLYSNKSNLQICSKYMNGTPSMSFGNPHSSPPTWDSPIWIPLL